jgi:hypothetical protein
MAEEADEFGPLKGRTTTPGKTPEQHAMDREIRAAAEVRGTGMLPRIDTAESHDFANETHGKSIGVNRRTRRSSRR